MIGSRVPLALMLAAASSLIGWLVLDTSAMAEERTLSWSHDACHNSVTFDPKRYDETRVRNTIHLLFGPADFHAPQVYPPFKPQDVAKLDLDKVNQQCATALDLARRLEFMSLTGIEEYRRAEIAQIEDSCQFSSVKIRAFRNPSVLREYQPAAATCSHFIDALEGKSDIMAAFREFVGEQCSRNGSPKQCMARFFGDAYSPNGADWIRLHLITFGWSNCANKFTLRNANIKQSDELRLRLEAEFQRTFKVTKDQCEAAGQD